MKKRLSSFAMALMMIVSLAVFFPSSPKVLSLRAHAYTAHTQAEALNWVRSMVGKSVDYDGIYGAQCVDLVKAYCSYLGVTTVATGNAKDYATNNLPKGWTRVKGGTPQPGDILVFSGSSSNQYGHVAIYEADRIHYHQNYCSHSFVEVVSYRYTGLSNPYWGYIRPDWMTPQGHVMSESEAAGKTIPDGDYWIFSELGLKTYLDIPGGDETAPSGTQITVYNYTDNMPKRFDAWTVTYLNNGFYKISQPGTNICLDVAGASLDQGTIVQTYTSNDTNAQQWSIRDTGHGYIIQSRANGYYLDVTKSLTDNGTKVITFGGDGTQKNQSWAFVPFTSTERPIADGEYYIKSATGNAWLDVSGDPKPKGNGYVNESNVQIWDSKTDSFNVKYISDGYYKIYETTSGLALDVYNPTGLTFGRGTNVQVYDGANLANRAQLWRIKDEGNGNYRLVSNLNGYSLDVNGGLSDKGTNVQVWTYNTSNAQKWSFEKVHKHSAASTVAKAATCTTAGNTAYWYCSGCKKYFSDSACTKEITLASTVTKATGHKYIDTVVEPTCTEGGHTDHVCSNCGDTYTDSETPAKGHNYTVDTIPPTDTEAGYDKHTCTDCGDFYIDNIVPAVPVQTNPTVSFEKGDGCVKLTWTAVSGADKYAVYGYMNNKWKSIAQGSGTSYTLKGLTAGKNYKVVVIARFNGTWNTRDISKAIVVTPNEKAVPEYPVVTSRSVSGNAFQIKWTAVKNAESYGIARYSSGKWVLVDDKIPAGTTTYTKKNVPAGTYTMVVCAKVNGKWDLNSINSRAFEITIK
ncbi:RICIN domain-containing protein [Ruminococcus sp.]|uniref:RICIN domain-containing protein n=1 Tax=Ruminococcus sp. TaxID=41978 RepID=UPI002589A28E|nr:RICIN domain-containing protein [Ruminococcus sp.]MCR5019594.1 RICIN domain-containing protein [Ruminococcus sp.]